MLYTRHGVVDEKISIRFLVHVCLQKIVIIKVYQVHSVHARGTMRTRFRGQKVAATHGCTDSASPKPDHNARIALYFARILAILMGNFAICHLSLVVGARRACFPRRAQNQHRRRMGVLYVDDRK